MIQTASEPLSVAIEKLRDQIFIVRGCLADIRHAHKSWGDSVQSIEGLLTCGLVSLYEVKERMIASEQRDREMMRNG